jgi:hypothetical protein
MSKTPRLVADGGPRSMQGELLDAHPTERIDAPSTVPVK